MKYQVECPGPSGREQSLGRRRREAGDGAAEAEGKESGQPGSKVSQRKYKLAILSILNSHFSILN